MNGLEQLNSRKKLIKLINSVPRPDKRCKVTAEQIAEHLIANNVIVLPCAIGTPVWIVSKNAPEPYPAKFKIDDVPHFGTRVFLRKADAIWKMRLKEK